MGVLNVEGILNRIKMTMNLTLSSLDFVFKNDL